jgi:formate hydrogenlyase subunit 6/NADH:ubiquinone oxidoreductase subunit I
MSDDAVWIDGDLLHCSFCGQCLDLCDEIIAEEQAG